MTPGRDRILAVLLFSASALVVVLSRKVGDLEDQVAKERFSANHMSVGSRLPQLRTTTLAGDSVTIGHPANGTRQLLLVFNLNPA